MCKGISKAVKAAFSNYVPVTAKPCNSLHDALVHTKSGHNVAIEVKSNYNARCLREKELKALSYRVLVSDLKVSGAYFDAREEGAFWRISESAEQFKQVKTWLNEAAFSVESYKNAVGELTGGIRSIPKSIQECEQSIEYLGYCNRAKQSF
jgi:hypothetical protein